MWLRDATLGSSRPATETAEDLFPWLPRAVSGDDGTFTIEGLPPGWFLLETLEAGFAPTASPPLAADRLPSGEVVLVLRPGVDLRLRAVDTSRRSAGGATATLLTKARSGVFAPRSPTAEVVARAAGDADGRIRLSDLRAGRYELRVEAPGLAVRSIDVDLAAGGVDLGDVTLELATRVEGWVVDPSGVGLADVKVRATLGPPLGELGSTFESTSGAGGEFVLTGLPGGGELYLAAEGDGVRSRTPHRLPLPPYGGVEIGVEAEVTVRGRVLDLASGRPVEGALVGGELAGSDHVVETLSPPAAAASETDAEGVFELRLFPGAYLVRAEAAAYQTRELEMVVDASRDPEPIEIELAPGEMLRGRVVTGTGRPVADVEVSAVPAGAASGPPLRCRSRADGRFELDRLGAGPYEVRADGGDRGTARQAVEAPSVEAVVLRLEPGAVLSGWVVTADGSAPAGEVYLRTRDAGRRHRAQPLDGGGGFRFRGLSAGVFTLRVSAPGWAAARREVRVAAGGHTEVVLELDGGGGVHGVVRGLDAQEIARCQVMGGGTAVRPAADGSFVLEDLPLGGLTITAFVPPGGPERSAQVELLAAGDVAEVELDFDSGLRLSGTVSGPRGPLRGVAVVLRAPSLPEASQTLTGERGSFELRALAPGPATVSVVDQRGRLLLAERLVLTHDVELALRIEDLAIRGQVVAEVSESPVPLARVRLLAVDGRTMERTVTTDASGRFELTDLGAGAYAVRADADGHGSSEEEVVLDRSSAPQVVLKLPSAEGARPGEPDPR